MELHQLEGRIPGGYTTFASVWGAGEVRDRLFRLQNGAGDIIPVQSRVTARWPDGSVKWAAHTADSSRMGGVVSLAAGVGADSVSGITVTEADGGFCVDTGVLSLRIPMGGGLLAEDLRLNGKLLARRAYPVLSLETPVQTEQGPAITVVDCPAVIQSVEAEEVGPLEAVFRFSGVHQSGGADKMPFQIRLYVNAGSAEMRFEHTFFYGGDEETDFLKSMGIRFDAVLAGKTHQRHVKLATDRNVFHEVATMLNSNYPRLPVDMLRAQIDGEMHDYAGNADVENATANLPVWDRYTLCQDSAQHYVIRKQTQPECCMIDCQHGGRARGAMAIAGTDGGLMLAIADAWQKYPSGFEVSGLGSDATEATAWFYSPQAHAYDFRHYATRSYPQTSYEGFDYLGASAYGIAVTSRATVVLTDGLPGNGALEGFTARVSRPAVYVGMPEYYHQKRAFGYWSLPETETETGRFLEDQLGKAFDFYENEIDARNWYGLFDYGDVMHTYDPVRHTWRYDVGGFAWQNTELVPTYWLWLYFLRTGRADVFTVIEAMTRHCADVDFYHFGPIKGIGTRHNVRHWGCSCKEPRVSMAGHHRFLYYLTGERRIGDAMDDAMDADRSMANLPRQYGREGGIGVRSGPDWSSFVSNWMTHYERTLDDAYRAKIETGIADIAAAPVQLTSGPEFLYDAETGHMVYIGDTDTAPNMHLQICMGGPQIWMETADMLGNETLKDMMAKHGRFYYLTEEERKAESGGLIHKRSFPLKYFATVIGAYSAQRRGDAALARQVWHELLYALVDGKDLDGFMPVPYAETRDGAALTEIPWIKTNFAAQWCLNLIMALEFIPDTLPPTLDGMKQMLCDLGYGDYHRS